MLSPLFLPSAVRGLTAENSSASGVQPAPSPKLSTTTTDMDVMKGEMEQLKGLILNLGKMVQALGERVERQFYSSSSNSSCSSCSPVHDCPDHSPEPSRILPQFLRNCRTSYVSITFPCVILRSSILLHLHPVEFAPFHLHLIHKGLHHR